MIQPDTTCIADKNAHHRNPSFFDGYVMRGVPVLTNLGLACMKVMAFCVSFVAK